MNIVFTEIFQGFLKHLQLNTRVVPADNHINLCNVIQ